MKKLIKKSNFKYIVKAGVFGLLFFLLLVPFFQNVQAASILQAINNAATNQAGNSTNSTGNHNSSGSILQAVNNAAVSISNNNANSNTTSAASSVSNTSSQSASSQSLSCPFGQRNGRTIVNFNAEIRSDMSSTNANRSFNVNLGPGSYTVSLFGYNGYSDRVNVTQPEEQYYLDIQKGGASVARTSSTGDLPDRVVLGQWSGSVSGNGINLSSGADTIVVRHSAYPNSNPNSLTAGCAAFDLISVTPPPPLPVTLNGSCSANPNRVDIGGYINWNATASGGDGHYDYYWTGTDNLSGSASSISQAYFSAGIKNGMVTITSGSQSITRNCSAVVNQEIIVNDLAVYCTASDSSIEIDEDVTWRAYASGGNGNYSYDWDGTENLNGSSRNITWSYDNDGTKRADITVYSGGQSVSASCTTRVEEEEEEDDNLSVTCYANPTTTQVGSRVSWFVRVSGGDGDYDYDWNGSDGLNSSSRSPYMTYNTPGTKTATVTVRDGDGERDSDTCSLNVNSVLAFSQTYQPPIESAVYLSQIPSTGVADNYKMLIFFSILALLSAWISYIVISYKKNYGEMNR